MRLVGIAVVLVLSLSVLAQDLMTVRDLGFQRKPFNPQDYGVIQRISLQDLDAGNRDDVYLTKISVENLGTATEAEIAKVEVRLETELGSFLLAEATSFPIVKILLPLPVESRTIPDDTRATLLIWIQVGDNLVEGHTVQPQVHLWYSEGDEGEEAEARDSAPEKFVVESSFTANALPGPAGGVLNPGDSFPIMEFQVSDTPDINFLGLEIVEATLNAPAGLVYELYNNATRIELPPGQTVRIPDGYFAALDEATGTLQIRVQVLPNFTSPEPVSLAPSLDFVVREGPMTKSFHVLDPTPDTVVVAGAESISVRGPQAGTVLMSPSQELSYSQLTVTDSDRNATPLTLDSLTLVPKGTAASQIGGVEITDTKGNLLAYGDGLGEISLVSPSGEPLTVSDDSTRTLVTKLLLQGPFPVGASLLLDHQLKVVEIHPYQVTTTHFEGVQSVLPDGAIFFGKPEFELKSTEQALEIWTTGETLRDIVGVIQYSPVQSVSLTYLTAAPPYRVTQQTADPETGLISFALSLSPGGTPAAGKVAELAFGLVGRVNGPVDLSVTLQVSSAVDTAGLELPFDVRKGTATITLTAPKFSFLPSETGAQLVVDSDEVAALEGTLRFDPPESTVGATILPAEGWEVKSTQLDEVGVLSFRIEAVGVPAAGPIFALSFPEGAQVVLAITGAWDRFGGALPFILGPDTVPPPAQ